MKWAIAAVTLVVVANAVVLVSAGREQAAPATLVTVNACAAQLAGGSGSDVAPTLRLTLVRDSLATPPGLDAAGLMALGFSEAQVAAVGKPREKDARWSLERPAWVRLRQRDDSIRAFVAGEVAPRREQLALDSTSLVVRGLVGFRAEQSVPAEGHQHGGGATPPSNAVVYPAVTEVIPSLLHLDREQIATLRAALPDSAGCATTRRVVIAEGANGGLWVHDIP